MGRRFVLVKFKSTDKPYLFEVPQNGYIHFGTKLKLENTEEIGTAYCDYFDVKDEMLPELFETFHTTEKNMKKVVGYYTCYPL